MNTCRLICTLLLLAFVRWAAGQVPGALPDTCIQAHILTTGADCLSFDNADAAFEGPQAICAEASVAGLWFGWTADFTGIAALRSHARFNDVISIYSGTCASLQPVACVNRDEHGFEGETACFPVQAGEQFLFRISGAEGGYGLPRGQLCVEIDPTPAMPQGPANDDCSGAVVLAPDAPCVQAINVHADMSASQPGLNDLARADVWFRFTMPDPAPGQRLQLHSNAGFSEVITLYGGNCDSLTERSGTYHGGMLDLPDTLEAGADYFIQIAGNFASVEGNLCVQLVHVPLAPPLNDGCQDALEIILGEDCTARSIAGATRSSYTPPCTPSALPDIWFRFTAPPGASVLLHTAAQFEHLLTIWQGDCSGLHAVRCIDNPLPCAGYVRIDHLTPGSEYYVQIAVREPGVLIEGYDKLCLRIVDGSATTPFEPLQLAVEQTCNSPFTAVLGIAISGGVAPYTVFGQQEGEELQVGAGYMVAVRDAIGCQASVVGTIDSCDATACYLNLLPTLTHPDCHGAATGSLTVQTEYGTAPYTFQWSDGSNAPALFGLPEGSYQLTVTDVAGCADTISMTLTAPPPLALEVVAVELPTAGLSNGSIQISMEGGTPPYAFEWWLNDTIYAGNEAMLLGIPEGAFRLRVTDANGCLLAFDTTLTGIVGLPDFESELAVRVFPNPTRGETVLYLALPEAVAVQISLVDPAGRVLEKWAAGILSTGQIPVSLRELPAGIYQIRMDTPHGRIVRQIAVLDQP